MDVRNNSNSISFCLLPPAFCLFALVWVQPQAVASPNPNEGISNQTTLQKKLGGSFPLQQLPPLGEPSQYLPQLELIPESPLQETRLVLKLSERRVYLYQDNQVQANYPVAIGRSGWETPTGSFEVIQMVSYPTWQHPFTGELIPPGPDNPLGVRWIGFAVKGENYIGFHGTPNEELIGQAVSHGCVRMRNKDVVSLFKQVEMGTPVMVEP
ncbi:MAG: L,D-transpeptidase family protein [Symploca sp. SIO2G7]|nr:L,D-transpeptidase family protein [Symploca sp. SIO2G7]